MGSVWSLRSSFDVADCVVAAPSSSFRTALLKSDRKWPLA